MKVMKNMVSAVFMLCVAGAVNAGTISIWSDAYSADTLNTFYDGLDGHSSSIVSGQFNDLDVSGVDLLWALQPSNSYTSDELSAMSNYLEQGGRIAFMGEHGNYMRAENDRINDALTFLGVGMQIQNTMEDPGFRVASVDNGQILAHSLTAGVNTYEYAAFAPLVDLSGDAQGLMLGEALDTVMMGFDNVGAGSVFLITDQNVWDNVLDPSFAYDNGILFENLVSASTSMSVPEPSSLALFAFGIFGFVAGRRKKA